MKYSFIDQHKKTWPIDSLCRLLGVYRNCFYSYQIRCQNKSSSHQHHALLNTLKNIAKRSRNCYGTRRLQKALQANGYQVGRSKVRSLMKEASIYVRIRKKYKHTSSKDPSKKAFENVLKRQFKVSGLNKTYVSDITYIWTREGWLYLAVVIDLFSRKVVGWSMGPHMKSSLVCDALEMAIGQRCPNNGLIVHSDQGVQYSSQEYRNLLKRHSIIGSMSRRGNCWDNAVAESFFGSLKSEIVRWRNYHTRQEAKLDILNYIVIFYNNSRLHSYIGYQCPNQFEAQA